MDLLKRVFFVPTIPCDYATGGEKGERVYESINFTAKEVIRAQLQLPLYNTRALIFFYFKILGFQYCA